MIKYHIACKANGDGAMDETKLHDIDVIKTNPDGSVAEFIYHNAHVFKIQCPNIGPAVAIYYDYAAAKYCIDYCRKNHIVKPVLYILTCRIGPFIKYISKKVKELSGIYMLNPDGHEFLRAKWSLPIKKYWKWSEKKMVKAADVVICDSVNIEKYIVSEYSHNKTEFIAYGAEVKPSVLSDSDHKYLKWMEDHSLKTKSFYLVVGRFVPENNYETMIREFMDSNSKKDFALITNVNEKFLNELEEKLHWKQDKRIKFVGTVYDGELLKKIRENAFAYFHGHEVGGTNPSLLEALASTDINLLIDVGFNHEVALDSALYWSKEKGNLKQLIEKTELMTEDEAVQLGKRSKMRIQEAYNWCDIAEKYKRIFLQE